MTLSTFFGILGLIANTLWPLITVRRYLLFGQIVACGLMFTHFYLLGAMTGAAIMLVAGIQAALALPLENFPKFTKIYLLSIFLTPIVCWYTWNGLPSILSSCALIIYCVANLHSRVPVIKLFLILCVISWLGHNLLVGSTPGIVSNLLALTTLTYSLFQHFRGKCQPASIIENEN